MEVIRVKFQSIALSRIYAYVYIHTNRYTANIYIYIYIDYNIQKLYHNRLSNMRCHYNKVNCLQNHLYRHLIVRPWERCIVCILWIQTLFGLCISFCSAVCNVMLHWTALKRDPAVLYFQLCIWVYNLSYMPLNVGIYPTRSWVLTVDIFGLQ